MTTALPAWFTGPVLLAIAAILAVRYRWFNGTRLESYLNNALAFLFLCNLLRENAIQQLLNRHGIVDVATARILSLAVAILAAAEFLGFVAVWARPEKYMHRHRNALHRGAAWLLAAAFLAAAEPARRAGQTLEEYGGWSSVAAWALLVTNLVVLAAQILRMSITELRKGTLKRRERVVALVGVGLGTAIGLTSLDAVVQAALDQLGVYDATPGLIKIHGTNIFFETVAVAALAAMPLAVSAFGLIAMDGTSRAWRALQPLRTELQAVVPPTTFTLNNPSRRKTTLDLHQTNVAIRDSILLLRPYFRELDPVRVAECQRRHSIRPAHRRYAEQAMQLADALAARAAGDPPAEREAPSVIPLKRSGDLEDEATAMLRLTRWWDCATESAAEHRRELELTRTTSAAS